MKHRVACRYGLRPRSVKTAAGCCAAVLILLCAPAWAQKPVPVDLELVFAADGSGSIDDEEMAFQRAGYAAAITHPRVLSAIRNGFLRRIAVAYMEWGDPESQHTIVGWIVIADQASARAFATKLLETPRAASGYNSISNALLYSADMIRGNRYDGTRRVIDVSGDGPNIGGAPINEVRRKLVAEGFTINALVVLARNALRGPSGEPLIEHYRNDVIGGPGSFALTADDRRTMADSLLRKLILEIAGARGRPAVASR